MGVKCFLQGGPGGLERAAGPGRVGFRISTDNKFRINCAKVLDWILEVVF